MKSICKKSPPLQTMYQGKAAHSNKPSTAHLLCSCRNIVDTICSFVESPDMINIYNGNVIMDENGNAIVNMPDWFDVLKKFRCQLTAIGQSAQLRYPQRWKIDHLVLLVANQGMKVSCR